MHWVLVRGLAVTIRTYARTQTDTVLSLLTDVGPMTTQELVLLMNRSGHGVRDSIRRLRRDKLVHIERYQYCGGKGRKQPVYAIGDAEDAVEVADPKTVRQARYRQRNRQAILARDAVRHGREVNIWRGLI